MNIKKNFISKLPAVKANVTPIILDQMLPAVIDQSPPCDHKAQLIKELSSTAPDLSTTLNLITAMLISNEFHLYTLRTSYWFDLYVGESHFNKFYFKMCVRASKIGLEIGMPPTLESISILLALYPAAPQYREEIMRIGCAVSGSSLPSVYCINEIIFNNNWAVKNKENASVDSLFSRLIQEHNIKQMKILRGEVREELRVINNDYEGIMALSLKDKQYLLMKIDNYLPK